jgi:hypothetical protein
VLNRGEVTFAFLVKHGVVNLVKTANQKTGPGPQFASIQLGIFFFHWTQDFGLVGFQSFFLL